jgi:hypothetical protein
MIPKVKLEPFTPRIAMLPVDERGYPIPWFVADVNGERDFRVADGRKYSIAISESLCWVCGQRMGAYKTFVIGPMCGINRVTAEPPSHKDCAEWSARNCPFLSNPRMIRDETDLVGDNPGGIMIKRNPGACIVWTTKAFFQMRVSNGHLIQIGDPLEAVWYARGRIATRDEVIDAVEAGCPALRNMAEAEGPKALAEYERAKARLVLLYPS